MGGPDDSASPMRNRTHTGIHCSIFKRCRIEERQLSKRLSLFIRSKIVSWDFYAFILLVLLVDLFLTASALLTIEEKAALSQIYQNFPDLSSVPSWEIVDDNGDCMGDSWTSDFDSLCQNEGFDYYGVYCKGGHVYGLVMYVWSIAVWKCSVNIYRQISNRNIVTVRTSGEIQIASTFLLHLDWLTWRMCTSAVTIFTLFSDYYLVWYAFETVQYFLRFSSFPPQHRSLTPRLGKRIIICNRPELRVGVRIFSFWGVASIFFSHHASIAAWPCAIFIILRKYG